MIFRKGDRAVISGKYYECICCDEQIAVLAPYNTAAKTVYYHGMVAYANYDSFRNIIEGLESINGVAL